MNKVRIALFLVLLAGCHKDEGRATYDKAMEEYGQILKEGLNEKNVEDAQIFDALLKVVIKAHPNENSAQRAKDKLDKLQKMALMRKSTLDDDLDAKNKSIVADMLEFEKTIRPLAAKAKKFENTRQSKKIDTDSCLVSDTTSEFEQNKPILENFSIDRVKKIGKHEVLLEEILHGSMSDLRLPSDALKRENPTQSSYTIVQAARLHIDCNSANKIVTQYRSILERAIPAEGIRRQLSTLESILNTESQ